MLSIANGPIPVRHLCYQVTQKGLALIAGAVRTRYHARRRKYQPKTATASELTVHEQFGFVRHRHMLHNCQPQTRSARRKTAAFIDTVETLSQARDMLSSNAPPLVLDQQRRPYRGVDPLHNNRAVLAILQRVYNEVANGAPQLILVPENLLRGSDLKVKNAARPTGGQLQYQI